jgi:uncharacterized repeat protein (TIGR01451 family)
MLIATGASLAFVAIVAQEPQQGALEVQTLVQKIVETVDATTGETTTELVPVDTALPGDEVVYTVTFKNLGASTADNIQITNPIPQQMRYVEGTAFGPGTSVVYSIDGGASYAAANQLRITQADGEERPAEPADYTHIRWALNAPLEAGEHSFARFRAVVR